jgi:hypothetical protein
MMAYAVPTQATPITVGNPDWYEFSFGTIGWTAGGCLLGNCVPGSGGTQFVGDPPWTFTGGAMITVQDAFLSGDQFTLYDNGVNVFTTSDPTLGGSYCDNPNLCMSDLHFSTGAIELGDGNHSLTFRVVTSPFDGGSAFFRADPVPEPASLMLLGTGALGLAARYRRRRQQQA